MTTEPAPPASPPPTPVPVRPSRAWIPVAIACVVAGLLLLFLLWPGVLLYPSAAPAPVDEMALVALQEDANRALEERIQTLRSTLDGNACLAEDGLMLRNQQGALEPVPAPGGAPLLPVPPDQVQVPETAPAAAGPTPDGAPPPESAGGESPGGQPPAPAGEPPRSLADVIDSATVLVLRAGGQSAGFGTGFFVAPDLIVTNLHVIGEPPAPEIYITSKALGRVTRAEVVAQSPGTEIGQPDFALLRAPSTPATRSLSLARPADRLQNVIAAGFPGLVMETDEAFRRLIGGDAAAVPEAAVTQGIVTARQASSGTALILHSAAVSRGNSGGPLVDQCGRVVGVNTFIRAEEEDAARMNYALATEALLAFLSQNGVQLTAADSPCAPALASAGGNGTP